MTLTLKVPSIVCEGCANTITKAIQGNQPEAQVSVDVSQKLVTVDTKASEDTIKKVIEETGHTVD